MEKPGLLTFVPTPLLEEFSHGRWLPLVGAGMSKNAIVPHGQAPLDWKQLGARLAGDLEDYESDGPLDAISAYEYSYGRVALVAKVSALLRTQDAVPGAAHAAFAELSFETVVTTNFDFLLEAAYSAASRPCLPLLEEVQLSGVNRYAGPSLLKLHGDVHHPERMIVTEEDYDNFILRHPLLATHLAASLIERTAVLIGYSLDDPDTRQILALVRDRLGRLARPLWSIQVGAPAHIVGRYARRGVHVINLPRRKDETYDQVLALFFRDLAKYWRANVLVDSQSAEDRTLAELRLPAESSRTCYFAVPLDLMSWYRDTLFPVAEGAGLVPVFARDVVTQGDTVMAKVEALIERAQVVVADIASSASRYEARLALKSKAAKSVLLIGNLSDRQRPTDFDGADYVQRPTDHSDASDEEFVTSVAAWMQAAMGGRRPSGDEAQRLLAAGEFRSAVIAAFSALEQHIAASTLEGSGSRKQVSLGRFINNSRHTGVLDPALLDRLARAWTLRNAALHEGRAIAPAEARDAVDAVSQALASPIDFAPLQVERPSVANQGTPNQDRSALTGSDGGQSQIWSAEELQRLSEVTTPGVRTAVAVLDVLAKQPDTWLATSQLAEQTGIAITTLRAWPAALFRYVKVHFPGHQSPIVSEWGPRLSRQSEMHYVVHAQVAHAWRLARSS